MGIGWDARKSAKTRRDRGEFPRIQAARIDGRSRRIFGRYRGIPGSVYGRLLGVRARFSAVASEMRENEALARAEWPRNPSTRIDGHSIRIPMESRDIPAIDGFASWEHSRRMGEIRRRASEMDRSRRKRSASGRMSPESGGPDRRPVA